MKIVKLTLFLNFYLIIFVCNLHIQNRLFSIFKFTAQDKFKSFKEHREEMSFKETSNYSNDKILQQGWLKYLELNEDDQVSTTQSACITSMIIYSLCTHVLTSIVAMIDSKQVTLCIYIQLTSECV